MDLFNLYRTGSTMSNKGLNKNTLSNQMCERKGRRKGERWRAKAKKYEGNRISNGRVKSWSEGDGGCGGWNIIDKYLKSKAGHRWDDVYSELVRDGRMDGFRERIHKSIEYNPVIKKEVAYYHRWGKDVRIEGPYVDNEGIIRYQTVSRGRWKHKEVPYIIVGGTRYIYTKTKCFWLDGRWCEVSKYYGNVNSPIIMEYKSTEAVKINKLKLDDKGRPMFHNGSLLEPPFSHHANGRPIIESTIVHKTKYTYIALSLHIILSDPSLKHFYSLYI